MLIVNKTKLRGIVGPGAYYACAHPPTSRVTGLRWTGGACETILNFVPYVLSARWLW